MLVTTFFLEGGGENFFLKKNICDQHAEFVASREQRNTGQTTEKSPFLLPILNLEALHFNQISPRNDGLASEICQRRRFVLCMQRGVSVDQGFPLF